MSHILFMIEGGQPLELVKQFIASKIEVNAANKKAAQEIGAEKISIDRMFGNLLGVAFRGERHPDFKVPKRNGICFPKKGSEWEKRFAELPRHEHQSSVISKALKIPLSISYGKESSNGWRHIGSPLNECGFLWLSYEGPYAMWIPDVPAEVAICEADGYVVGPREKQFKPEFDGCRRIYQEEWDILIAQQALAKKRAEQ